MRQLCQGAPNLGSTSPRPNQQRERFQDAGGLPRRAPFALFQKLRQGWPCEVGRRAEERGFHPRIGAVRLKQPGQEISRFCIVHLAQRECQLQPDLRVDITSHREHQGPQRGHLGQQGLCQPEGIQADPRDRITQPQGQQFRPQRLEVVQCPEAGDPGRRRFGGPHQQFQWCHRSAVLPLVQQPGRCVAIPAMGAPQVGHQLDGGGLAQPWRGRGLESCGRNPIDPPPISTTGEIQMPGDVEGNMNRLQHFPTHVEAVQVAIGTVEQVHGAEPDVGRTEEFGLLLHSLRSEGRPLGHQCPVMDQVVLAIAHEDCSVKLGGPAAAAVHLHSGSRVDHVVAGPGGPRPPFARRDPPGTPDLSPPLNRADAMDRNRAGSQVLHRRGDRQVRIPGEIMLRQNHLQQGLRFTAGEAIAEVVEGIAELHCATDRLEDLGLRVEPEIPPHDIHGSLLRPVHMPDLSPIGSRGAVDLHVGSHHQVVQHSLLIVRAKSGEDPPSKIGSIVAIGVFEVPDVGGGRDIHPLPPGSDSR